MKVFMHYVNVIFLGFVYKYVLMNCLNFFGCFQLWQQEQQTELLSFTFNIKEKPFSSCFEPHFVYTLGPSCLFAVSALCHASDGGDRTGQTPLPHP